MAFTPATSLPGVKKKELKPLFGSPFQRSNSSPDLRQDQEEFSCAYGSNAQFRKLWTSRLFMSQMKLSWQENRERGATTTKATLKAVIETTVAAQRYVRYAKMFTGAAWEKAFEAWTLRAVSQLAKEQMFSCKTTDAFDTISFGKVLEHFYEEIQTWIGKHSGDADAGPCSEIVLDLLEDCRAVIEHGRILRESVVASEYAEFMMDVSSSERDPRKLATKIVTASTAASSNLCTPVSEAAKEEFDDTMTPCKSPLAAMEEFGNATKPCKTQLKKLGTRARPKRKTGRPKSGAKNTIRKKAIAEDDGQDFPLIRDHRFTADGSGVRIKSECARKQMKHRLKGLFTKCGALVGLPARSPALSDYMMAFHASPDSPPTLAEKMSIHGVAHLGEEFTRQVLDSVWDDLANTDAEAYCQQLGLRKNSAQYKQRVSSINWLRKQVIAEKIENLFDGTSERPDFDQLVENIRSKMGSDFKKPIGEQCQPTELDFSLARRLSVKCSFHPVPLRHSLGPLGVSRRYSNDSPNFSLDDSVLSSPKRNVKRRETIMSGLVAAHRSILNSDHGRNARGASRRSSSDVRCGSQEQFGDPLQDHEPGSWDRSDEPLEYYLSSEGTMPRTILHEPCLPPMLLDHSETYLTRHPHRASDNLEDLPDFPDYCLLDCLNLGEICQMQRQDDQGGDGGDGQDDQHPVQARRVSARLSRFSLQRRSMTSPIAKLNIESWNKISAAGTEATFSSKIFSGKATRGSLPPSTISRNGSERTFSSKIFSGKATRGSLPPSTISRNGSEATFSPKISPKSTTRRSLLPSRISINCRTPAVCPKIGTELPGTAFSSVEGPNLLNGHVQWEVSHEQEAICCGGHFQRMMMHKAGIDSRRSRRKPRRQQVSYTQNCVFFRADPVVARPQKDKAGTFQRLPRFVGGDRAQPLAAARWDISKVAALTF